MGSILRDKLRGKSTATEIRKGRWSNTETARATTFETTERDLDASRTKIASRSSDGATATFANKTTTSRALGIANTFASNFFRIGARATDTIATELAEATIAKTSLGKVKICADASCSVLEISEASESLSSARNALKLTELAVILVKTATRSELATVRSESSTADRSEVTGRTFRFATREFSKVFFCGGVVKLFVNTNAFRGKTSEANTRGRTAWANGNAFGTFGKGETASATNGKTARATAGETARRTIWTIMGKTVKATMRKVVRTEWATKGNNDQAVVRAVVRAIVRATVGKTVRATMVLSVKISSVDR